MNKLKTTEDTLLEILLGIILFITIGAFMYAIKSCTDKESCEDSQELTEMMEYHSTRGYWVSEHEGILILKK